MAVSLSTYASTTPDAIRVTVINYIKKQLRKGVQVRNEILKCGKIDTPSVLTKCVLNCDELNL
jgi:hypothetical protein